MSIWGFCTTFFIHSFWKDYKMCLQMKDVAKFFCRQYFSIYSTAPWCTYVVAIRTDLAFCYMPGT
jgi:hypothetical protein